MATASLEIDIDTLAAAVADKILPKSHEVMLSRRDIEHVALSMADCFSDAEADVLNRLRAALGLGPVEKVGQGATRHWRTK
ncbi:hypothetical protein AB0H76_15245 [Nocardia sp. NPDC050712]|uniref:hypothetical protein n=1 Tax=Nocardia sp. NPDC050712 TaxID=3155518 RepID=UPI0033D6D446